MCWNEWIINFPIFIFRAMIIFLPKTVNFRWIFTITRKIKKIGKLIFHSIQHIMHLSLKWKQNWRGRYNVICRHSVLFLLILFFENEKYLHKYLNKVFQYFKRKVFVEKIKYGNVFNKVFHLTIGMLCFALPRERQRPNS